MNNVLLSVIIPVYNTSSTLRRCLDSVCNQTYKNLEIIIVDDGSTDGAERIVDEYAACDCRVKLVHQSNSGESAARNCGLRLVTGDYYTFVDCDDWLELDMYEQLVRVAVTDKVDLVACSWIKEYDDLTEVITNAMPVTSDVMTREQLLMYVYKRDMYRGLTYMWDKIYRRNMMFDDKHQLIEFREDLVLGGDVVYLARMVLNAKSARYIDKAYYHYYQRSDSGGHTIDLDKRLDWLQAYFIILEYISDNKIQTDAIPWIERFLAYHASNVAELAYNQKNQRILKICQEYMSDYQTIYERTNQEYPERIERYRKIIEYKV